MIPSGISHLLKSGSPERRKNYFRKITGSCRVVIFISISAEEIRYRGKIVNPFLTDSLWLSESSLSHEQQWEQWSARPGSLIRENK